VTHASVCGGRGRCLSVDKPPRWLNVSHPRVRIVRHADFFHNVDKGFLPTFNSDAIHVNIHRIPGLGDHFINWCDDFFLGAPVQPSDWFTPNGDPVVRASLPLPPSLPPSQRPTPSFLRTVSCAGTVSCWHWREHPRVR
jgi:hypothetical protein